MPKYASAGKSAFFLVVLVSAGVLAGGTKPTQDFWDYMMEYSDEQGEILDPLEYEQIHSLRDEQDSAETNDSQPDASKSQSGSQFERLANKASMTKTTSLKNTSSSSPSSKVSAKGAAL